MTGGKLIDRGPSRKGWHWHQTFMVCPRLWALHYLEPDKEKEPRKMSDPLVRGTLVHCGLAHVYKRLQLVAQGLEPDEYMRPYSAIRALAKKETAASGDPIWEDWSERCQSIITHYNLTWGDDTDWEILNVEDEIEVYIEDAGRKHQYTQRPDMVARRRSDGKVYIWDHKCVATLHRSGARRQLSGQFLGYRVLGQSIWGEEFGGVMLNLVSFDNKTGKVSTRREYVKAAPFGDQHFTRTIKWVNRAIEMFKKTDLPAAEWPGAHTEYACWRYNTPCEMAHVCNYGPTL
tara:strand:+ start:2014 stop:2880 length:867 start_codon:yes stop_codon:yes gene_type:complete